MTTHSLVATTARTESGALRSAARSVRRSWREIGRSDVRVRALRAEPANWPKPDRSGRSWRVTIETDT